MEECNFILENVKVYSLVRALIKETENRNVVKNVEFSF